VAVQVTESYPTVGGGSTIQVDAYPDTCPVCHTSVQPVFLLARTLSDPPAFSTVDVVFQCTKPTCRSIIIGRYKGNNYSSAPFVLASVMPETPQGSAFNAEIETISPTFVEVYNQAMAAEAMNLDQLVGMGLRKALEFLVKDFAISLAATDEEKAKIKKKQLGPCIEDHIKDVPVRKAAKRATWLGNDETHYERRWVDQDITDLKNLVRLTVNAVESAILMQQYETEMPGA